MRVAALLIFVVALLAGRAVAAPAPHAESSCSPARDLSMRSAQDTSAPLALWGFLAHHGRTRRVSSSSSLSFDRGSAQDDDETSARRRSTIERHRGARARASRTRSRAATGVASLEPPPPEPPANLLVPERNPEGSAPATPYALDSKEVLRDPT